MIDEEKFKAIYPTVPGTYEASGLPGHGIIWRRCAFRLHHHLLSASGNRYTVSTIGGMFPPTGSNLEHFDPKLSNNCLYETMVFDEKIDEHGFLEIIPTEIDSWGVNDSIEATIRHYKMIAKWLGI